MATESTEQVFGVVRQIPHEDYSSSDQEHDIMLIELDVSYIFLLIIALNDLTRIYQQLFRCI